MESAVTDFLHYCRLERRLAPLTCSTYERDVAACLRFLQAEGVSEWAAVRPADLRRFLADEAPRRPAPSSQARTVAALKGFFRFLVENEEIERDPAHVLRTPKKREALPAHASSGSRSGRRFGERARFCLDSHGAGWKSRLRQVL